MPCRRNCWYSDGICWAQYRSVTTRWRSSPASAVSSRNRSTPRVGSSTRSSLLTRTRLPRAFARRMRVCCRAASSQSPTKPLAGCQPNGSSRRRRWALRPTRGTPTSADSRRSTDVHRPAWSDEVPVLLHPTCAYIGRMLIRTISRASGPSPHEGCVAMTFQLQTQEVSQCPDGDVQLVLDRNFIRRAAFDGHGSQVVQAADDPDPGRLHVRPHRDGSMVQPVRNRHPQGEVFATEGSEHVLGELRLHDLRIARPRDLPAGQVLVDPSKDLG